MGREGAARYDSRPAPLHAPGADAPDGRDGVGAPPRGWQTAATPAESAPWFSSLSATQFAAGRERDRSQLTNRNPPGASNFGWPGPGVICSCSSSTLFLEQSQHARAKSVSRRVWESSITWTYALSDTGSPFRYRWAMDHNATALLMVGTSGVCTPVAPW